MCGRPLGCKSKNENSDGRVDCDHVSGLVDAAPCPLAHVWTARKGQGWISKISGGSKAVMCPASLCGNMTAGPDRFRERHPNRWAVFIYHGPARISSFVGSTDHYLLLRP